jgi:hypothetical protein
LVFFVFGYKIGLLYPARERRGEERRGEQRRGERERERGTCSFSSTEQVEKATGLI